MTSYVKNKPLFYQYYLLNILDILCLGKYSRQWSWRRRKCDSATMQCMYVLECQLQTVGNTFYDPMHVVYILQIGRWVKQYRGRTCRRNGVCFPNRRQYFHVTNILDRDCPESLPVENLCNNGEGMAEVLVVYRRYTTQEGQGYRSPGRKAKKRQVYNQLQK